jgi:anaerobic carbon-monoxide dehydrogenase iron sulfur subunit
MNRNWTSESPKTIQYLTVDLDLCSGCRSCMAVCSLAHSGYSNPEISGIQVIGFLRKGNVIEASTCLQCPKPKCLSACLQGAIFIDKTTGAKIIDAEKCTGCKICVEACPNRKKIALYYDDNGLSPIRYNTGKNICFKCDLCGGDPLCVKTCPLNALHLNTREG